MPVTSAHCSTCCISVVVSIRRRYRGVTYSHLSRVVVRTFILLLVVTLLVTAPAAGQGSPVPDAPDPSDLPFRQVPVVLPTLQYPEALPDAPSTLGEPHAGGQYGQTEVVPGFVNNVNIESHQTDWPTAGRQSFLFLSVQHSLRLLQPKTRHELKGKFFRDYAQSVKGIHGWGDGDGIWTNYFMHPGMGSVASFIYIQNTPASRHLVFDASNGAYWRSRLKAMAFAAAYSTQFEIGAFSEATIGNVGMKKGTSGYVDFVMTPVGGFGLTVLEDLIDERYIRRTEERTRNAHRQRLLRTALNPERSIANLLRFKSPWYRDTRPMPPREE